MEDTEPATATGRVTLVLEVEDTGIGIPKDQLEHIFGAFAQVSRQSTRKFGGTGLGLAITRRLTEMMQGTISVRSQQGQGRVFRFTFPNVAITELPQTGPSALEGDADFSRFMPARILVADDIALNRQLLAGYFEGTGHRLIVATNGLEALAKAEQEHPAVILMDMRMPDLDGYQATQRLKANPPCVTSLSSRSPPLPSAKRKPEPARCAMGSSASPSTARSSSLNSADFSRLPSGARPRLLRPPTSPPQAPGGHRHTRDAGVAPRTLEAASNRRTRRLGAPVANDGHRRDRSLRGQVN